MAEIMLNVPDITCDHCARTIDQTLSALAGVRRLAWTCPPNGCAWNTTRARPI